MAQDNSLNAEYANNRSCDDVATPQAAIVADQTRPEMAVNMPDKRASGERQEDEESNISLYRSGV